MLIDLPTAKLHLRVDGAAEDAILALYIGAAEQSAMDFLNRKVYADQVALDEAVAAVPAALSAAQAAYAIAVAEANALTDYGMADARKAQAFDTYTMAHMLARETRAGMVVNAAVKAAILLILGHLYANREDVVTGTIATDIPMGSRALLMPYRTGMGV